MKTEITFSCGHMGTVELFGSAAEREKKIAYFQREGLCKDCFKKAWEAEAAKSSVLFKAPYSEYKEVKERLEKHGFFGVVNTKNGTYDAATKTVEFYMKKEHNGQPVDIQSFRVMFPGWIELRLILEGEEC